MKSNDVKSQTLAICFGQFGPYHHARVGALQGLADKQELRVVPVQISSNTATYEWKAGEEIKRPRDEEPESAEADGDSVSPAGAGRGQTQRQQNLCEDLRTLCAGVEEEVSPLDVFLKARRLFRGEKVDVAFLPSYSPARFFALFAAAKSLGIRTVMMNESHAGTERATGWKRWIKRQIVKRFDAAFVGGEPHKRHFASLGIPAEKIFTGYDAVDGDFFAQRADEIRAAQRRSRSASALAAANGSGVTSSGQVPSIREAYCLPERYFLSLGRMVEKKNLSTLVEAYARFARASVERSRAETGNLKLESGGQRPEASETENRTLNTAHCVPALVFVGSGELENSLREQARALGLRVVDCTAAGSQSSGVSRQEGTAANCKLNTEHSVENDRGAVFFYGFRQIEENAVFYALAEVFVLPSLKEEWGLVVNEAMACSLPVIVSRTAGCAEDLLPGSESMEHGAWGMEWKGSEANENKLEERSNGFVFDPKSVDALATALARVAEMGDRRSEMGRRSREIVAKFGCENFAKQAMRAACAARGGGCESYW